jgi:hypothetical protein
MMSTVMLRFRGERSDVIVTVMGMEMGLFIMRRRGKHTIALRGR